MVKDAAGRLAATGATEHDVQLMRQHCSDKVQVKASGGMRSFADAQKFVKLGATRLGTSATEAIAAGERGRQATSAASY
jgi:deoxyribose-phosphate aldolase